MSARLALRFGLCSCLVASLVACGDDAGDAPNEEGAEFEGCPDSIPEFSHGMSAATEDGDIQAVLREASPSPPARFFNHWTVELTRADGSALEEGSVGGVRAFMPVHGHYGTPDPRVRRRDDEPAVFDIEKLNLFMRGPWEVTLTVSSASGGDAAIVFEVCVEE